MRQVLAARQGTPAAANVGSLADEANGGNAAPANLAAVKQPEEACQSKSVNEHWLISSKPICCRIPRGSKLSRDKTIQRGQRRKRAGNRDMARERLKTVTAG